MRLLHVLLEPVVGRGVGERDRRAHQLAVGADERSHVQVEPTGIAGLGHPLDALDRHREAIELGSLDQRPQLYRTVGELKIAQPCRRRSPAG
jgi:hypothetical protein